MAVTNDGTDNRNTPTDADVESPLSDATHNAKVGSRIIAPCRVAFTHVRKRLADVDGLSGKAVLDGIVLLGVLADDSPQFVTEVTHRQETGDREKTIVTLTPHETP